ncbi:hypothetical protein SprV_0501815900 [Sparganum proliferum]
MFCHALSEDDALETGNSDGLVLKIKPECLQHQIAVPEIEYDPEGAELLGTGVLRPDPHSLKSEPPENAKTCSSSGKVKFSAVKKSGIRKCFKCNLKLRTQSSMLRHMEKQHPGFDVSSIFKTKRRRKRLIRETDASDLGVAEQVRPRNEPILLLTPLEELPVSLLPTAVDAGPAAENPLSILSERKGLSPEKPDERGTPVQPDVAVENASERPKRRRKKSRTYSPEDVSRARPKRRKKRRAVSGLFAVSALQQSIEPRDSSAGDLLTVPPEENSVDPGQSQAKAASVPPAENSVDPGQSQAKAASVRPVGTSYDGLPEKPTAKKKPEVPSRYECEFCGREFLFRRQLVYHVNSMHINDDKFKCQYCGRFYGSTACLRDHVQVIHEGFMRFKCHLCPKGFPRIHRLDEHLHVAHNLPMPENETPSERRERIRAFPRLRSESDSGTDDPSAKSTTLQQITVRRLKPHRHQVRFCRKTEFRCSHCRSRFAKIKDRDAHLTTVHPDKYPFRCASCDRPCPSETHLRLHLTLMHREDDEARPFACSMCPRRFVTEWNLRVHQHQTHEETAICSCEWCGQVFVTYWRRTKHMQKEHPEVTGTFHCLFCKAVFHRAANHRKHMARYHKSEFEKCGVPDVPRFQCPHCGKSYSAVSNLRSHISNYHKPLKPFACAQCTKTYNRSSLLHRHVLHVHNVDPTKTPAYAKMVNSHSRFTCQHCGQFYTTPRNLSRHLQLVHEEPAKALSTALFQRTCTLCKRHFSSSSHLRSHIKYFHKGGVTFRCPECSVAFASAFSLQKHKFKCHGDSVSDTCLPTGQDIFTCEICPSKFVCISHLEDHMKFVHNSRIAKTETGETRRDFVCFPCDICKKLYIGRSALQRHLTRVHNTNTETPPPSPPPEGVLASIPCHECPECGLAFQRAHCLQKHINREHNASMEMPPEAAAASPSCHECPHCGRTFPRNRFLKRHLNKEHNDKAAKTEAGQTRRNFVCFPCDMCKKFYFLRSTLRKHRAQAHDCKETTPLPEGVLASMPCHECPQCGRAFRSICYFQRHMDREHKAPTVETTPSEDVQPTTASNSSGTP